MKTRDAIFPLRHEIDQYSHSCERLISAALMPDAIPFKPDEIEWIAYYAKEMSSLVDRLLPESKPQGAHERQTMQDYARTSEACLEMKDLSKEERKSIRDSVADIREKILDADERSR